MIAEKNKKSVRVGIFTAIGLVFFVVGVLAIGNINKTFTKSFIISTVFDDVNGLKLGNNIWFSGVKIGTVKEISFYGSSQVKVVMDIEEKSRAYVKKDALVKLGSDGLIGNKILIIYGGTEGSPKVETGDVLTSSKPFGTEDMMATLQDNNLNILSITSDFKDILSRLNKGEGTVGKLLLDDKIYNDLQTSLSSLQNTIQNVNNLTANIKKISDQLDNEGYLVNDVLTDTAIYPSIKNSVMQIEELTTSANTIMDNLTAITDKLETDTESPAGVLLNDPQVAEQLKETITNLQAASKKLDENMEALQHNFLFRGYFK